MTRDRRTDRARMRNERPRIPIALVAISLALCVAFCAHAQFVPQKPTQWYNIEPWEAAVCSKWGGRSQAQQIASVETGVTGYGPFTYTLLAKKTTLHENNQTLYTYGYYLESYSEHLQYSIDLYNPVTHRSLPLAGGTLDPGDGIVDQKSEYLDQDYTHIRLIHQYGSVLMPIVEVSR